MGKRQVKNESALKEIRLPEEGEMFGRVIKMMGGENVMVKCGDNVARRGRIRGKLKRRVWIRDNDIVIIAPLCHMSLTPNNNQFSFLSNITTYYATDKIFSE